MVQVWACVPTPQGAQPGHAWLRIVLNALLE